MLRRSRSWLEVEVEACGVVAEDAVVVVVVDDEEEAAF